MLRTYDDKTNREDENAEQLAKECLSKCRLDTEKKYGCTLFKNLIAKFQISTHLSVQQLQFVKR